MRLLIPQHQQLRRPFGWALSLVLWAVLLTPMSASALEGVPVQPTCTGGFDHPMQAAASSQAREVFDRMVSWGYGPLTPVEPETFDSPASRAAQKPVADQKEPCGASSGIDPTNPEYNICFEGTREPVSTLPDLLARYQAEEVAGTLFDVVAQMGVQSTGHIPRHQQAPAALPERPWLAALVDLMERSAPLQQDSPLTCSEYSELCRSLPPATAGVALSGLVPVLSPIELNATRYPELSSPPTQPALERLRVGPALEHRRLLEEPPQHS
ncbi:hypothetical protein FRC98_12575 [Lujinxingia vulgaris]|uniref:Uncharacterized protein n=1 Tax=Lujinxingia vulgaris TaxID=2600176 RepID=A0A5C6XHG3_9DELT|nr:hypothetical protein [Lujinxingia vulgaris]TXD36658.1 hypothetical protein FRC98_12575 [Lujinxingia vulgaris]